MKDKEVKVDEMKSSLTLGGSGECPACSGEREVVWTLRV